MMSCITFQESGDSDQDYGDGEIFFSGNIEPFSFEPTCSEEELRHRLAALNSESEDASPSSPLRADETSNCSCGLCTYLDNEPVNICCHSTALAKDHIEHGACVTQTEDFKLVCLYKTILKRALGVWHHTHGEEKNINNNNYRFIAYRQYIGWIYGRLGRNERRPIPSCVLGKIRETFPSPDNTYIPFSYDA